MKAKYLLLITLITAILFPVTFASAKQLDPEKEPNFYYTVVDSNGTLIRDPSGYLFPAGKPKKIICRGFCNGWDMYLEPGKYEMVLETLHIKDIEIEEGKKLNKVIVYDRQPSAFDSNFSISIFNEDGKDALDFWYFLYDSQNPKKIFCFCTTRYVSYFKLPEGTYTMEIGFLRKLKVKNIRIEEGKYLMKAVMLPPSIPSGTNEKPLIPINKGSYQRAIPKILRAIERVLRNGNYLAIEAFLSADTDVALAQSLVMNLGFQPPVHFRHKILRLKQETSPKQVKAETEILLKGKKSGSPAYFIFQKIHDEWFIIDTNLADALAEETTGTD